jgi:hypothetical protein
MYVCVYVCMCVCVYVYMCICVYVCMCVYVCICVYMCVCVYMCICVYVYMCIYVYVYIQSCPNLCHWEAEPSPKDRKGFSAATWEPLVAASASHPSDLRMLIIPGCLPPCSCHLSRCYEV